MAWEWVPPVAGGVVALLGIGAAYYSSHTQQQTALKLSREERRWQQTRIAYEGMLEQLSRFSDWVDKVYPMITSTVEEYAMPSMDPIPDSHRLEALQMYWSPEIRALVTSWRSTIDKLRQTGLMIGMAKQYPSMRQQPGYAVMDLEGNLPNLKSDVRVAVEAVRDRCNFELMKDPEHQAAAS